MSPAQKCSYRSTKKLIRLKQKDSSKRWIPVTSNRCPDHLSRQSLITASTFAYSSKNCSAADNHALPTRFNIIKKLTHSHRQTHTLTHTHTHTHTHTPKLTRSNSHTQTHTLKLTHSNSHTQTHTIKLTRSNSHSNSYTHTQVHREYVNMFGWEIFRAVWNDRGCAVVRNCLLRWPGHLFEVTGTHLFDQFFFCFKHISLFPAQIGAFFPWYIPILCYTKDFTCRSGVTLNPCISEMTQDLENKNCF